MIADERIRAIRDVIQQDVGNRGLARDTHDNLFTATPGDFEAACWSVAGQSAPSLHIVTGFLIPSADPPAFETDGPLGAVFLIRALVELDIHVVCSAETRCAAAIAAGLDAAELIPEKLVRAVANVEALEAPWDGVDATHVIALERPGPAANGRYHTMRGRDITGSMIPAHRLFDRGRDDTGAVTIGIGDGGNEIGMGRIPHETIVKNIPSGDLIHCRTPTDYLIVAGVSNWGAYGLVAGIWAWRSTQPPLWLFDVDREREILEVMVREGPLVDGVTGKQTATVDGLSWDEYAKPLVRIREILESPWH
jgi:hypothetical protein